MNIVPYYLECVVFISITQANKTVRSYNDKLYLIKVLLIMILLFIMDLLHKYSP